MTTLIFWGGIAFIALMLLARVPGLNMILLPVGMMVGGLLKEIVVHVVSWGGYVMKMLYRAHRDYLDHLLQPEEEFDIELKLKKREENY